MLKEGEWGSGLLAKFILTCQPALVRRNVDIRLFSMIMNTLLSITSSCDPGLRQGFKGDDLLISLTLLHNAQINLFHPLGETYHSPRLTRHPFVNSQ